MRSDILDEIQEWDPQYDPLEIALTKANVSKETWDAACDRVYFDGYYGPLKDTDWKEQDGRQPYSVKEALKIIATVLDGVDSWYNEVEGWNIPEEEIRAALVSPWFREIYSYRYPQL